MYSHKHLSAFIQKVNEEATKAAQAIYDKYNDELVKRIKSQLRKGDELIFGMGTATFSAIELNNNREDFVQILTDIQYWDKVEAGFTTNDILM